MLIQNQKSFWKKIPIPRILFSYNFAVLLFVSQAKTQRKHVLLVHGAFCSITNTCKDREPGTWLQAPYRSNPPSGQTDMNPNWIQRAQKIGLKDTQNRTQGPTKSDSRSHKIRLKDPQNRTQGPTKSDSRTHKIGHRNIGHKHQNRTQGPTRKRTHKLNPY